MRMKLIVVLNPSGKVQYMGLDPCKMSAGIRFFFLISLIKSQCQTVKAPRLDLRNDKMICLTVYFKKNLNNEL